MVEEEYFRNSSVTIWNNTQNDTLNCLEFKFHKNVVDWAGYLCIVYLYIHSIFQLAFDTVEHYELFFKAEHSWMGKTPKGRKKAVVHVFFYRITQTVLYIILLVTLTCRLLRVYFDYDIPIGFDNFSSTINTFLSILQSAQLLPAVGHFVVALQRL